MSGDAWTGPIEVAAGWTYRELTPRTLLAGANGIRFSPDGILHAVSALGSRVVRLAPDFRGAEILSEQDNGTWSPDDLAFTSDGTIYLADYMMHRVCRWREGVTDVIQEDVTLANGICTWGDRIFVNEYRNGGRLLEVFPDEREPVVLADDLAGPNGMSASADGFIYFVQVYKGEVSRISVDGGPVESVITGLMGPTSARVGADGRVYVSQPLGEVVAVDPVTGESAVVAQAARGIDNLEVDPAGHLYLSYYADGAVRRIAPDGAVDELVRPGLMGPFGLHAHSSGLTVADGIRLLRHHDGSSVTVRERTDTGFPGFVQGIWEADGVAYVTTAAGQLVRYDFDQSTVLVAGLVEPKGIALGEDRSVVVAVAGEGRVLELVGGEQRDLASGLGRPVGVSVHSSGDVFVSDEARGELVRVDRSGLKTVVAEGLSEPQGVAVIGDEVFVAEAGAARIVCVNSENRALRVVATGVPIGRTVGGVRAPLPGVLGGNPHRPPLGGPIARFADLASDGVRTIYVSCEAVGAIGSLTRA